MQRSMKELPNILMPDMTEDMYAKLCHTIGMDKKTDERKYFYPHRNYYDCGEADIPAFKKLTEMGLCEEAEPEYFKVTLLGINTMSIISGINIYNPCAKYDSDLKRYVIRELCRADVYCGDGCWCPVSIRSLCNHHILPEHRVRKIMQELVSDGYAVKSYYGSQDEEGKAFCYHGYFLTVKAQEWDVWKKEYQDNLDYLNKTLRGEI